MFYVTVLSKIINHIMEFTKLGNTNLNVSKICLGTMTFGEQNTENDAHEQLDYAVEQDINFIDTAELYAVPARKETYGLTETYIGTWLKKRKNRSKLVIATKIAGPGNPHIRGGKSQYNRKDLTSALHDSLKRLQTDYIDLYQLHWPERKTNFFGQLGYTHVEQDGWEDNFIETLSILDEFINAGKIRYIGLSNETPWGVMRCLHLAEKHNLPKILTIQNPYNLVNRTFEVGLAEIAHREQVGLLAYSPLAFGLLTGKYFNGEKPKNARLTLFKQLSRYNKSLANEAAKRYVEVAIQHKLSPAKMAIAFINSRSFLSNTIIGATTLEQLKENIDSINLKLSDEIVSEINKIHLEIPNPAP